MGLLRESTTEHEKYKLDIIVEANKPPITVTIDREGGKVSEMIFFFFNIMYFEFNVDVTS